MKNLLFLLPLLVLAGCGGKMGGGGAQEGWVKYDAPAAQAPAGWIKYEDTVAGFSVYMPPGWVATTNKPDERQRTYAALRQAIPGVGDVAFRNSASIEFDVNFEDLNMESLKVGVLQSMSVQVKSHPVEFRLSDVEKTPEGAALGQNFSGIGRVTTPAGTAAGFKGMQVTDNLASGGQSQVYTHMYFFGRERHFWLFAFTYSVDNAAKMDPIVKQILETVRFSKPDITGAAARRKTKENDKQKADDALRNQQNLERDRQAQAAEREQQRLEAIEVQRQRQEEEARRQAELLRQQQEQQNQPPAQEPPPVENPPTQEPPPAGDGTSGG
jgi:hypothetical protein